MKEDKYSKIDFFGYPLEIGGDVSYNSNKNFMRLGITGSIVVSIPIMLLRLALWPVLFLFTEMLLVFFRFHPSTILLKIVKIRTFLLPRMLSCFENSLLILVSLSCNQYKGNIHSEQLLNRISVYFTVFLNLAMFALYVCIFRLLKQNKWKLQKNSDEFLST